MNRRASAGPATSYGPACHVTCCLAFDTPGRWAPPRLRCPSRCNPQREPHAHTRGLPRVRLQVWAGNPAKKLRDLKPSEREHLRSLPSRYTELGGKHGEVINLLRLKQEEFSG